MKLSLLFLPLVYASFTVPAQTSDWIRKNGPVGGVVTDLEVDPVSGNIFLVDDNYRSYQSTDGGVTWKKITIGVDEPQIADIEITNGTIFLVGSYELFASTDNGTSFQERMTAASPYEYAYRLKRMPVSGNLVVLTDNGIYTSADNGETWTRRTSSLTNLNFRHDLVVNDLDQIFVLENNVPKRSDNSGANFTEVSTGLPASETVFSLSADNNGENVYCVTASGIFTSVDGANWTSIKDAAISAATISDFPYPSFLEFTADGLGMFFVDNLNHVLYSKTVDAPSWEVRSGLFPLGASAAMCASAIDYPSATTSKAFFGTTSGVLKTATGGASASESNAGFTSVRIAQILFGPDEDLYIRTTSSGMSRGEVLESEDGGNTWTRNNGISGQVDQLSRNDEMLFAMAEGTLYRAYSGASWQTVTPLFNVGWIFGIGQSKVFALSGMRDFYYSADNGDTWTASPVVITGLPTAYSIFDQHYVTFTSENQMFLRIYDGDVVGGDAYYRIDFTYDTGGAITSAVASPVNNIPIANTDIFSFDAANGRIYIFDNYSASADRIAVSADGGVSWTVQPVPESDEMFVTANGYVFLSDGGLEKIHISRDGGATFTETSLSSDVDLYRLNGVTLDAVGNAYLAIDRDYLYQSQGTVVTPAPLSGLEEVGHASVAVALRWVDPNAYERTIIIERSLNGTDFVVAGTVEGWDVCYGTVNHGYFIDTGAQAGQSYYYRVKAKNTAGESTPTSTITVTTPAACTQDIPDNRSWTATNSGVEGYPLVTPKTVGIRRVGIARYEITDLSLGLTGSSEKSVFYVNCGETFVAGTGDLNPNGNGTWDPVAKKLTLKWRSCYLDNTETITATLNSTDPAPAAPAMFYGVVLSDTEIQLNWAAGYYEATYVLERSTVASFTSYQEIATINYPVTTYTDATGLTAGTTYYYRVKSRNANTTPLESPYSTIVAVPMAKPNFVEADNAVTNAPATVSLGSFWADFDNDGFEDYMTIKYDAEQERGVPIIFKNLRNGDFQPMPLDVGDGAYTWPSIADYNNDHYPDLVLAGDGELVLDLFRGNGDFTFTKVPSAELGDLGAMSHQVSASSWADINNDGLVDLLVVNPDDGSFVVYRQNANLSFTKVFRSSPSEDEPLLTIWCDYDEDGYQDVLIGNGDGAGGLYRNNGDETFTMITGNGFDGAHYASAAWGDYNNDGHIDLYCGVYEGNVLYKNNGDGTFTKDESTAITEPNTAVSASWGDFNNDGFLDLVTAGFASGRTRLFLRDPSFTSSIVFKKITTEKINDPTISHYSAANADPDKNGLLDIQLSALIFDDDNGDAALPAKSGYFENNNAAANWIAVKLNPANGSTEALGAKITLTAGGKTQTRQIASSSSLASRNSLIAHFGLGTTTVVTNIRVQWPDGSIQNYPAPPINQEVVIDEDVDGPAIVSVSPANNATDVPVNTTVQIGFDENTFAIAGKMLALTKTGETTPFTSVDVSSASRTGNQFELTLPVELASNTEYNVTLEAGAFRDRYANPTAPIPMGAWKFTTRELADTEAPQISFTALTALNKGFGTVSPTITVTDNKSVSTVTVSIRKISGPDYTEVPGTLSETDSYTVNLSESTHFDANGAEFFITATDASGNSTRDPAGTATYKIYLTYDETQSTIPSSVLGFGGQVSNWKVFTIPFALTSPNDDINIIFDEFEGLDSKKDYRLITLNDAGDNWKEFPSFTKIARGIGYFINIRDIKTIKLPGTLTAPGNARANLFPMTLEPGWNMVGNPYLTPVDWADVSAYNNLSGDAASLIKYNGSGYAASSQTLQPYEGGFVNNPTTSPVSIAIPFDGQTSAGRRRGAMALTTDPGAEAWMLPLDLQQGEKAYNLGAIGMAPDASPGLDAYDRVTPPRFFDYLELNFSHPEHFQKRFTREVVPTQQHYTWNFTIDSNLPGMTTLTWNNAALVLSAKDLFLLDVGTQKLLDMKEVNAYRFDPRQSSAFRIYFGEDVMVAPDRVHLGHAFPNPANGVATVGFSLPETGGLDQRVSLQLFDALGRPSKTIAQGRFNPGFHEATFDTGGIGAGFYTYRLTVRSRNGLTTETNKLIIK